MIRCEDCLWGQLREEYKKRRKEILVEELNRKYCRQCGTDFKNFVSKREEK